MIKVPTSHDGAHYISVLADLSRSRNVRRYLEVGVETGQTFAAVACEVGVAVDPKFIIRHNIMQEKKRVSLFQTDSDSFFREEDVHGALGGKIDLAFLDGMHWFEYLLRDFFNTEKLCAEHALIAMHDCLPLNAEMAHRDQAEAIRLGIGGPYKNYWTGDVWKVVSILKKYRPDLGLILCHAPPTGVVLISNLDPTSTVLPDNYSDIVEEFSALPNDLAGIASVYEGVQTIGPATY